MFLLTNLTAIEETDRDTAVFGTGIEDTLGYQAKPQCTHNPCHYYSTSSLRRKALHLSKVKGCRTTSVFDGASRRCSTLNG